MSRLRWILPILALAIIVGLVGGLARAERANGASLAFSPPTGLSTSSLGGGVIRFDWDAGTDNTWYCVDTALSPLDLINFTGTWWAHGCGTTSTVLDVAGLGCGQLHYWRVWAVGSNGSGHSFIAQFVTPNCFFTPPAGLTTTHIGSGVIRFDWNAGEGNSWYCVDTALSVSDLVNFKETWWAHSCGITSTVLDVSGLGCNELHYWRVWAVGANESGHSSVAQFVTPDCDFTAPSDPDAAALSSSSVRFTWERGENNLWFCVDAALSEDDLLDFENSWRNYGCGTTATELEVTGLECGTTYHWRVYADGPGASGGHSPVDTIATQACPFSPPTGLESEALSSTSIRYDWESGSDNLWFCVDTAESLDDLRNFGPTFANHGCGTTATMLEVTGLECDTEYFWRVYARGTTVGGHSVEEASETLDC